MSNMDFMGTPGTVLCCLCGIPIRSNPSNMCVSCISTQIDVTEDIQKEVTILHCPGCESYFHPPKQWIKAAPESKELLSFCLKKTKGLSKVKLVDAEFVWTEPHSKRIKVKVTVQKEFNGAIIQGSCVVVFVVHNNICQECNRRTTNQDVWTACVQVRQHVPHKRTFFFLEQLILKHNAHEHAINMKSMHEGVDFYFAAKPFAQKFVEFLQGVIPVRFRHDRSLVSHDKKSNVFNYKYAFSVEIAPICKDDLICLPAKVSHHYGGVGPLVICTRITSALQCMDPVTLKTFYMDATTYWRYGFKSLRSSRQLTVYVVLDVEPLDVVHGKFRLAEATIARESDLGTSDRTFFVYTHLGNILKPGDLALGYDLLNANFVNDDLEAHLQRGHSVSDVILIKKSFDHLRKKRQSKGRNRKWKVEHLDMEIDETAKHVAQEDLDRELFLQEIEEDPELQSELPLTSKEDFMMTDSENED